MLTERETWNQGNTLSLLPQLTERDVLISERREACIHWDAAYAVSNVVGMIQAEAEIAYYDAMLSDPLV